jgi:hypothetical protein
LAHLISPSFGQNSKLFLEYLDIKLDGYNGAVAGAATTRTKDEIDTATTKKERSVLQAKLTRLAIQIGYAGWLLFLLISTLNNLINLSHSRFFCCHVHCAYIADSFLHFQLSR